MIVYDGKRKSFLITYLNEQIVLKANLASPRARNNMVASLNSLAGGDDHFYRVLVENLNVKSPLDSYKTIKRLMKPFIDLHCDKILDSNKNINTLETTDYRHGYYEGDSSYNDDDYKELMRMRDYSVVFTLLFNCHNTDEHTNAYIKALNTYDTTVTSSKTFKRLKAFLQGHINLKAAELIDLGELYNVIPKEDNVYELFAAKSLYIISHKDDSSVISGIYDIVRKSRNPAVMLLTKQIVRADEGDTSWLSSFGQTSVLTIGQKGEVMEMMNEDSELIHLFNLTKEEIEVYYEGLELSKLITRDRYIYIPKFLDPLVNAVVVKVLPLTIIKYLEVEQMQKVLALVYALSSDISKDLQYIVHSVPTEKELIPSIIDSDYIEPEITMAKGVDKHLVEQYCDNFFGDVEDIKIRKEELNNLTRNFKDICYYSLKGGIVIDAYGDCKQDMAKFVIKLTA